MEDDERLMSMKDWKKAYGFVKYLLKNPRPIEFLKSVKNIGVGSYYALKSFGLEREGNSKMAKAYLSLADKFADTWGWLHANKGTEIAEVQPFITIIIDYRFD